MLQPRQQYLNDTRRRSRLPEMARCKALAAIGANLRLRGPNAGPMGLLPQWRKTGANGEGACASGRCLPSAARASAFTQARPSQQHEHTSSGSDAGEMEGPVRIEALAANGRIGQ